MRQLFAALRTLHIYLSLAGFVVLLFFAVTGVLLVHSEALGLQMATTRTVQAKVPGELLAGGDHLAIVERLRALGATGALTAYEDDPDQVHLVFERPSARTEAQVRKSDGQATLALESRGPWALFLDLHTGKSAGAWWIAIDAAGILWVLSSCTGIALWLQLRRRRAAGIFWLAVGCAAALAAYLLLVES